MKHVFWILPSLLCGRSGPNHDPWNPAELLAGGIGAVLSVNQGDLVHPEDFESLGVSYQCTPLSADAPPRPGDLEICLQNLPIGYDFVISHITRGSAVLVHCRHGKDRTGLFMGYFLKRYLDLTTAASIDRVRRERPAAFTATGWDKFAVQVLDAC